jgi:hypothetical protein
MTEDIEGAGWRIGGVAAPTESGQIAATDSPKTPFKTCRLDEDAVFG